MVVDVSGSAGPVVGVAVKTTVSPSVEIWVGLTETMPGTPAISSVRALTSAASTPGGSRSTTTSSGALIPVPKPSASRSYACRWVVCAGASPAAGKAVWIQNAGIAIATRVTTAPSR